MSVSLTDGSFESEIIRDDGFKSPWSYVFFKENCAINLKYESFSDPQDSDKYILNLNIRLWADGRSTETYVVEVTDEALLMSPYIGAFSFTDAAADLQANTLTIEN